MSRNPESDRIAAGGEFPAQSRVAAGFSLLELMAAMLIVSLLLGIGISVFGRTAATSRRTAMDQIAAAIEQARTTAITRRKPVLLAVAPPLPGGEDEHCRIGVFEVDELPGDATSVKARQLQRWELIPTGIVFTEGKIGELRNLMDEPEFELTWKDGANRARVRALAFTPRGGLAWPKGSDPVALRISAGSYHDGSPVVHRDGGHSALRVGRVVARSWKLDG